MLGSTLPAAGCFDVFSTPANDNEDSILRL